MANGSDPGLFTRTGLAALRGLTSPSDLVNAINEAVYGQKLAVSPAKQLYSGLSEGYTPEQLEPQSFPERVLQKTAESVPLAGLLGGAPAALTSTIGSAAGATAGQLGLSPILQDLAQIGTELGTGRLLGKLPTIAGKQKKFEELAKGAVKAGEVHPIAGIKTALNEISNKLSTETNDKIVKRVSHAADILEKNIASGLADPNQIRTLRKNLYQTRKTFPKPYQHYIDNLTKGINKNFALNIAENPDFFNNLSKADRFTELKHMKSYIEDFADKIGDLIPTAIGGKFGKKALNLIFGKTLGGSEKFFRNLINNPTARSHYMDITQASLKQDPAAFIKGLQDLIPSASAEPEVIIKKKEKKKPIMFKGRELKYF